MINLYYAEDDETVAQAVKEYLEQENFRVTVFSMLADMKQALRSRQPDMVLLDWNMPDGQGSKLCGWLRARWSWLPVIFLTVCRPGESELLSLRFSDTGYGEDIWLPYGGYAMTQQKKQMLMTIFPIV